MTTLIQGLALAPLLQELSVIEALLVSKEQYPDAGIISWTVVSLLLVHA